MLARVMRGWCQVKDMDPVNWIAGRLTTADRIVSALLPALLLCGYFCLAAIVYRVRNRRFGQFHDEEMDARGPGGLTSKRLRHFFAWFLGPSVATALGCLVGALVSFALSRGWVFEPGRSRLLSQIGRYAFVSVTNAGLNAGAIALLLLLPQPFVLA